MAEHLKTEDIKNYLKQTMPPVELLKADDHLALCDACAQTLKDAAHIENVLDAEFLRVPADSSGHLEYEQLENYLDENDGAIEREIADVHFQVCAACRGQLNGLIEMRNLIDADLQKQLWTEIPAEKSSAVEQRTSFFDRAFLRYGFAATVLLFTALAIFWLVRREGPGSQEIAVTPPAPANLPDISPGNAPANVAANTPQNNETNLPNRPSAKDKTHEFPPVFQTEIERAIATNRLNIPLEIEQLGGRNGRLMGGGNESVSFALENPLGKIIQTDRPQFRWRPLAGANGYIVSVYDANFNRVAGSSQITNTSWQIDRPLVRNKIYSWQVTALKDGEEIKSPVRPAPDAKFKIIDAARANELARLSREFQNEHLALGILYANAGLLDEAAREFQKEIAKNPNSKTARTFLRVVRGRK